jgi:2-phospho-L-lactate guanylyltransferase
VQVAALVPLKSFRAAKGRLRDVLSAEQRVELAQWMASGVIATLGEIPTFVACDDDEVAEWSAQRGAEVLWGPGLGLNGAVDDGVEQIVAGGADHVIVCHADLPRPAGLLGVVRSGTITLVPDRHLDGTNVMAFPAASAVRAAYGAGSFQHHAALARAASPSGAVVEVRFDPELSIDVDTAEDIRHPLVWEVMPSWVRTSLASPA